MASVQCLPQAVTPQTWVPGLDRSGFIGGSDVPHLIGQDPFGCRRRLYYGKMGLAEDYPFLGNRHTERGTRLEPIAVEEYTRKLGRTCRRMRAVAHPAKPYLAVHVDRQILSSPANPHKGPGVLEVKCPSQRSFQRIRMMGIPYDYPLQAQWGMALTGWRWGSVWCWCADEWAGVHQDLERDDELCDLLLAAADWFYLTTREDLADMDVRPYRQIPPRIEPADRRCFSCPYRRTCQQIGEMGMLDGQEDVPDVEPERDESLAELVAHYIEATVGEKEAQDWRKQLKAELQSKLGERRAVDTGNALVLTIQVQMKEHIVKAHVQKRLRVKPRSVNPTPSL